MIIQSQKQQDVKIEGQSASKQATIDASRISKLQYILTKGLYTDPKSAVITELSNNGVDAIIESGKDAIQNPVMVEFKYNGQEYIMSIEDKGVGMDKDFFENRFMSFLDSTKDTNNDQIGG